jgi:hypothetical protein
LIAAFITSLLYFLDKSMTLSSSHLFSKFSLELHIKI